MWTSGSTGAKHPEHNAIFNDNMAAQSTFTAAAVASAYDFSAVSQRHRRRRWSRRPPGRGARGARERHRDGLRPGARPRGGTAARSVRVGRRSLVDSDGQLLRGGAAGGRLPRQVDPARLAGRPVCRDPDSCRAALNEGGVVLVVERVLGRSGRRGGRRLLRPQHARAAGWSERTEEEYAALFAAAGLRLREVTDTLRRSRSWRQSPPLPTGSGGLLDAAPDAVARMGRGRPPRTASGPPRSTEETHHRDART